MISTYLWDAAAGAVLATIATALFLWMIGGNPTRLFEWIPARVAIVAGAGLGVWLKLGHLLG